ncbi:MAG: hypothetical protein FOGNACKC_03118 [Anaerolineae bacterium]|nr:hypothetical protein [Anaerolineae bacterium]
MDDQRLVIREDTQVGAGVYKYGNLEIGPLYHKFAINARASEGNPRANAYEFG